jgi:hypothetical protein
MPDYTLTYCRRATRTEEILGIFHSAAHAKTHTEAWALHHLGPICEWREQEQENGEVWFETEEKHSQVIPRGKGLHRFLIRPIPSSNADLTAEEDLLANEEPGSFFV